MHSTLHKYLALYKELSIPGIGCFAVEETPATLQFTDKQLHPPASHVIFNPSVQPTNNHFYSFLAREWNVEKVIAIRRFKEEVEVMIDTLKNLGRYELPGIGILHNHSDATISFTPSEFLSLPVFSTLPADRILRRDAQHTVLVGEQEHIKAHTLPEVKENALYVEEPANKKWTLYALILAILAILMIVFYYAVYK